MGKGCQSFDICPDKHISPALRLVLLILLGEKLHWDLRRGPHHIFSFLASIKSFIKISWLYPILRIIEHPELKGPTRIFESSSWPWPGHSRTRPLAGIFPLNAVWLASFIRQSQVKYVSLAKISYYKLTNHFMHS